MWFIAINNQEIVVFFLLGNSQEAEIYVPTFRSTLPVPFS